MDKNLKKYNHKDYVSKVLTTKKYFHTQAAPPKKQAASQELDLKSYLGKNQLKERLYNEMKDDYEIEYSDQYMINKVQSHLRSVKQIKDRHEYMNDYRHVMKTETFDHKEFSNARTLLHYKQIGSLQLNPSNSSSVPYIPKPYIYRNQVSSEGHFIHSKQ